MAVASVAVAFLLLAVAGPAAAAAVTGELSAPLAGLGGVLFLAGLTALGISIAAT